MISKCVDFYLKIRSVNQHLVLLRRARYSDLNSRSNSPTQLSDSRIQQISRINSPSRLLITDLNLSMT